MYGSFDKFIRDGRVKLLPITLWGETEQLYISNESVECDLLKRLNNGGRNIDDRIFFYVPDAIYRRSDKEIIEYVQANCS